MLFVAGCEANQVKFAAQFDLIVVLSAPAQVVVDSVELVGTQRATAPALATPHHGVVRTCSRQSLRCLTPGSASRLPASGVNSNLQSNGCI